MPFFFYLQVGFNSSQLAMLIKNYCNFLTRNYARALGQSKTFIYWKHFRRNAATKISFTQWPGLHSHIRIHKPRYANIIQFT